MRKREAFTLIELLIVVAIIAILAAIAVPNLLEAQARAKVTRCVADMKTVGTAIIAYQVDWNQAIRSAWYPFYFHSFYPDIPYNPNEWFIWVMPQNDGTGKRLTSPVSYLSSLPGNIYHPATMGHGTSFGYIYAGPKPLPGRTTDGAMLGEWWGGVWNYRQYSNKWVRWMLYSSGPTLGQAFSKKPDPIYDPTNGTVSDGNIYYVDVLGIVGGTKY